MQPSRQPAVLALGPDLAVIAAVDVSTVIYTPDGKRLMSVMELTVETSWSSRAQCPLP